LKPFFVSVWLGRTELADPTLDLDLLAEWLEERLSHITARFEGYGRIRLTPVADLGIDVCATFVVDGGPILDVMDKFRSDLEVLQALAGGIDIAENENFQTLLPHGCWGTTRRNFCPGRS
jgi:hypothetical protein